MNLNFKTIDKSEFECVYLDRDDKTKVYFGQTIL